MLKLLRFTSASDIEGKLASQNIGMIIYIG